MVTKLESLSLKDLPKKDKLITIDPDEHISVAFDKIFSNRIRSAPVIDKNKKLIGLISIIDITLFALNVCHSSQELARFFSLSDADLVETQQRFVDFGNLKNYLINDEHHHLGMDSAAFITNYSRQSHLQVLPPNTSLKEVINVLTQHHHVAIGDDELQDFLSQSDIVKFLKEKDAFGELGTKTIKELNLGSSNVISVKENQRVVEAFKLMLLNKVSGLAVVDDYSHLMGQISSSDIKCITHSGEMLSCLYETYPVYRKILVEKYNVSPQSITVSPTATLKEVVDALVQNKIHRVFVVKADNTLESVISLTDILNVCVRK